MKKRGTAMENKVFLWEMDSVRNSERECQLAREALYRALLVDGNVVVMTFNQLADARWMLPILEDEKEFGCLMQLFKMGVIRVSHYKNKRTASRYIQESLQTALKSESDYIFSGMPIDSDEKELLQEILDALQYSDPELIAEHIAQVEQQGSENSAKEKKRLMLIYRYVKLILLVSQEKTADNAPAAQSTPFIDILHTMFEIGKEQLEKYHVNWLELYEEAVADLERMTIEEANQNKRSCWYDKIEEKREQDQQEQNRLRDFQKCLIDVCYNYTVQSSIEGVVCLYDMPEQKQKFMNEFVGRVDAYHQELQQADEPCAQTDHFGDLDWSLVVEIREDVQKYEERRKKWHLEEKLKWPIKVAVTQIWLPIRNFLFYFVMFLLINIVVEKLSAGFELLPQISTWMSMDMGIMALIETVLFGVIGSLLSKWFAVPDILDIWSKLFHKIWNEIRFLVISKTGKGKKHELRTNN